MAPALLRLWSGQQQPAGTPQQQQVVAVVMMARRERWRKERPCRDRRDQVRVGWERHAVDMPLNLRHDVRGFGRVALRML
jgi:hypothetical protein